MANLINFNGKTYTSLDDMPADVRRLYEQVMGIFGDQNQDGVPEAFAGLAAAGPGRPVVHSQTTVIFNGQVYASRDQMPPAVRADYEQAQAQFDADGNGLPDAMESLIDSLNPPTAAASVVQATAWPTPARPTPSPYNTPVVSPESGSLRFRLALLAIIGLGAMVCVLLAVVVWALLR